MSLAEFDEIDFTHSAPRLDRPSEYLMKKAVSIKQRYDNDDGQVLTLFVIEKKT